MRTYILEGVVTALSSITHNGGEQNGTVTQLRREKVVQPDGSVEQVPCISGNAIRGLLRDIGYKDMFQRLGYGVTEDGSVRGVSLNAFYFFFSGGSLTSTGDSGLDIGYFRELKSAIPLVGVFGGAVGNAIMQGKLKMGKLIPICRETGHQLPAQYVNANIQSIWDYCQTEMYTRTDDEKKESLRGLIGGDDMVLLQSGVAKKDITKASTSQQMMYHIETIAAGTEFYWKIVLDDVTDIEYEAFVNTLYCFSRKPYIGGKSGTGHGEISIKMDNWIEIDSRVKGTGTELAPPLLTNYYQHLEHKGDRIRTLVKEMA